MDSCHFGGYINIFHLVLLFNLEKIMNNFEESYLKQIEVLFDKYRGRFQNNDLNEILNHGCVSSIPAMNADILICGINPSYNEKSPNHFSFHELVSKRYFSPLHKITETCTDRSKIDYIDLFCFRRTNQNDIWKFTSDSVGVQFITEHLIITQNIIEQMKPKLILVFNKDAANFFGVRANPDFTDEKSRNIWMGYRFKCDESDSSCIIEGLHKDRINKDFKETNLVGTRVFFSSYMRYLNTEKRNNIKDTVSNLIKNTL